MIVGIMAKKTKSFTGKEYLQERVESKAFKKSLEKIIYKQIQKGLKLPIKDVLPYEIGRQFIDEFDVFMFNPASFIQIFQLFLQSLEYYFEDTNETLIDFLGQSSVKDIENILNEKYVMSENVERIVREVMHSDFIKSLFTEAVHLSIVSFYKKVNPIFGGMTAKVVEKQVKGLIKPLIKIVVDSAAEYVIRKENQQQLTEFLKNLMILIVNEPVENVFLEFSPRHRKKSETLLKNLAKNSTFEKKMRKIILYTYEYMYEQISTQKVELFIAKESQVKKLAYWGIEFLLVVIKQDEVISFLADELTEAFAQK